MSESNVGILIKEARAKAGLSQQALADKIPGLSASSIGKAERGEKELTTDELKAIAKATGVTQKSLLEAAAAGKNTATSGKTSSTSKPTSTTASKPASTAAADSFKLTAAERKLVELYRAANADTKKKVLNVLKGESSDAEELISSLLGNAMEMFLKK